MNNVNYDPELFDRDEYGNLYPKETQDGNLRGTDDHLCGDETDGSD